jgi:hypothetical protein
MSVQEVFQPQMEPSSELGSFSVLFHVPYLFKIPVNSTELSDTRE